MSPDGLHATALPLELRRTKSMLACDGHLKYGWNWDGGTFAALHAELDLWHGTGIESHLHKLD